MLIIAVWLVIFPARDFDTFWHLANGREMINQGRIIHEEIFSYSAFGTPFTNHYWLAQILMFLVFQKAGINGLILAKVIFAILLFLAIFKHSKNLGAGTFLASVAAYSTILIGISRFVIRPQLFSYLFLAITILLIYGYTYKNWKSWCICILPPLFIIWDFMHGAIFGYVFVVSFLAGEFASQIIRHFTQPETRSARHLKRIVTLTILFSLIFVSALLKPNGFELYTKLFSIVGDNYIFEMTREFTPTPIEGFIPFWILLFLIPIFWALDRKNVNHSEIIVIAIFSYLGTRYMRCVEVFAITATPFAAFHLSNIISRLPSASFGTYVKYCTLIILLVLSLYSTLQLKVLQISDGDFDFTGMRTGVGINQVYLPIGAIDFIKEKNLQGNMFNSDRFGGLSSYYLYPERPIFHYNHPEVFTEIYSYLHNPKERAKWNHQYAFIAKQMEISIFESAGWATVYKDLASRIMVNPKGVNSRVANSDRIFIFDPLLTENEYLRMGSNPKFANQLMLETSKYLAFNQDKRIASLLGLVLQKNLNWLELSENQKLVKTSLIKNPKNPILLGAVGLYHYRSGNLDLAKKNFEKAYNLDSTLVPVALNLGYIYLDLKHFQKASTLFSKALNDNANHPDMIYGKALAEKGLGNTKKANELFKKHSKLLSKKQSAPEPLKSK